MSDAIAIDNLSTLKQDETATANIGKHLAIKYPGYPWLVQVDGGVATIRNLALSGKWGFVIHQNKIDNDFKAITRAAGELLERYNLTRGAINLDQVADLKRDFSGEVIHDKSK